jgi:hypothetical protein
MEKPIENMKNLAYVRLFQPERLHNIEAIQTEKYAMLKEIDEDVVNDLKYINTVKSKLE